MDKIKIGKLGENTACQYLVDKGYNIIRTNYAKPWGEIDIIAKSPDKTLVFIEVKTLRQLKQLGQLIVDKHVNNSATTQPQRGHNAANNSDNCDSNSDNNLMAGLKPEDHLTLDKYKKLCRTSEFFSRQYPRLINKNKGWRIDLIAIELTNDKNHCLLKHYQNIVL